MHHHVELQALKQKEISPYEQSKTCKMGASLTWRKFSTVPGDLVTEVTVNREVKNRSDPKRGGNSTSLEAVDDFILNTHALGKLHGYSPNSHTGKRKCMASASNNY